MESMSTFNSTAVRKLAPGLALASAIAVVSVLGEPFATDTLGFVFGFDVAVPAIVLALIVGMAFHIADPQSAMQPGLTFAIKKLLRVAIALLGLRIALSDIAALGLSTALVVIVTMVLAPWPVRPPRFVVRPLRSPRRAYCRRIARAMPMSSSPLSL